MKFALRLSAAALFLLALPLAAQTPAPAYKADPEFKKSWDEARLMERQHRYSFAEDAYKKANKLAGGKCLECLHELTRVQIGLGEGKPAISSAMAEEALASTPVERSVAFQDHANAVEVWAGTKPKPAQLQQIHDLLQQSVAAYPRNIGAQFQDGRVLAQMGDTEHARLAFAECAKNCRPNDPARFRAQHFAENPELSLHKMAPAFEVKALDGTRFNLDNTQGRVVLIDFWATWCGPCNESLPELKKIAARFKDEPLTIISISWDSDDAAWRSFVNKNEMTWLQYRDSNHKLSDLFEVHSIPHYFTIDSDGVLTAELVGSDANVEGKLKKLLAKARDSKKPQDTASLPTAHDSASIGR